MRNFVLIMTLSIFCLASAGVAAAAKYEYPAIKGYGPVVHLPHAAVQPNKELTYKILCDVVSAPKEYKDVNPGLNHVARIINVFASAGWKPQALHMVVIIHGAATDSVLKNSEYKKHYNVDNPNIKLIQDLKREGVKLFVCGQALADNQYRHAWVNPNITIALSALVVIPTYELEGYAFMPM